MAELITAVAQPFAAGEHNLKVVIPTTGTVLIEYQVADEGFDAIPSASYTASTGVPLFIPSCEVKATITGTGVRVFLNRVQVDLS